jgi:hypothetical protein
LARQRAQEKLRAAAAGKVGSGVFVSGRCNECGALFTRKTFGSLTDVCSARCRDRRRERTKRAAELGGARIHIGAYWIHFRDRWVCHVCGDPVDRNAVVPDLAAPTLDHVVPLAKGGAHHQDNLKTAHFWCNCVKNDRPLAEVA